MKIIMATRAVFPYHGYGGMQLYIYHLAKALVKNKVEVEIITSYIGKDEIYSEMYEGIKYTFLPHVTSELYKDNVLDKKPKGKSFVQKVRDVVPAPILAPIAFIPTILFLVRDTVRFLKFSEAVNEYLKDKTFDDFLEHPDFLQTDPHAISHSTDLFTAAQSIIDGTSIQ